MMNVIWKAGDVVASVRFLRMFTMSCVFFCQFGLLWFVALK